MKKSLTIAVAAAVVLGSGATMAAGDPALTCQAGRLGLAGKYALCRLRTETKALVAGTSPDFTRCSDSFSKGWTAAGTKAFNAGGFCLEPIDQADVVVMADDFTNSVAAEVAGNRFDASGDTIVDHKTGLEWEKKTTAVGSGANASDPHDVDNVYSWCAGTAPSCANPNNPFDGTAATDFLARLNGSNTGICYAGHCDWRLPTVEEYEELLASNTGGAFGTSVPGFYWTSSTYAGDPSLAWNLILLIPGHAATGYTYGVKPYEFSVRAVRSGT